MTTLTAFPLLCTLLEQRNEVSYSTECLASINSGLILFDIWETKTRALSIRDMKTHLDIQTNITGANIEGYIELLESLDKSAEEPISECILATEKYGYIILVNASFSHLVGILQSPHNNINRHYASVQEMLRRGYQTSCVKMQARKQIEW